MYSIIKLYAHCLLNTDSLFHSSIQDGAINGGTNWFFKMYRISSFIDAYGCSDQYSLVCVGLLAIHLYKINFIFLSDNLPTVAEREAGLVDVFHQ
jgi:hypothetical protein